MKAPAKIETYDLDVNFVVQAGHNNQDRYTTFAVYSNKTDGTGLTQLSARWSVNSLQDWEPHMDRIKAVADAYVEQYNRLADLFAALAEKNGGSLYYEGYDIAFKSDAWITNRGTNPTEAVMVADCIAFCTASGEWTQGRIYWPITDGQLAEDVDYDAPDDLDLATESDYPEDLEDITA